MSIPELMNEIIAIYEDQAEQYQRLAAVYEQEKNNLLQGRGDEKVNEMLALAISKTDLMRQIEEKNEKLKALRQKVMDQLEIHDFRISLLKKHIQPAQKESLYKTLDQIGKLLVEIRAQDTENQKLLQEYLKNQQPRAAAKNVGQAMELYRQSVRQGNFLKKL